MYHYKAESDWYYTLSLIHFNMKRNILKPELPMKIHLHCGVEKLLHIFRIACSVSLGNASYYGGKMICKLQSVLTFYVKRFPAAPFAVLFIV